MNHVPGRLFFLAILILAFQLLVAFPIAVWLQNRFDFNIEAESALILMVVVFCVVSLCLVLLLFLVPGRVRAWLFPLFVLLTLLVYLQQNVLVWDYGFLDGKAINFEQNRYLGLVDLALWSAGVLAFLFLRKQVTKRAGVILLFTGLLTVLATAHSVSQLDFEKTHASGTISDQGKFSFSQRENILVFVLDGFQSDLFWDLVDNEPGVSEGFAGFTFYPNTSAVFAKTYPSIPLMLTGEVYTKQQPFSSFLSRSYRDSLLTSLLERDWDVGLYPRIKSTVPADDSIMSNYRETVGWREKAGRYLVALDLSLYRAVPHFMKSRVYNDGNFVLQSTLGTQLERDTETSVHEAPVTLPTRHVHEGVDFLQNLQVLGETRPGDPAFRFYHLNMPHEPFLLDRNLDYGLRPGGFSAYREYAYASTRLMAAYLDELKRLGAYDNATIIITADHGGGEYTVDKYVSAERTYVRVGEHGQEMASGKPLLLVKQKGEKAPLRLSFSPVSLLDIAPTIASAAGMAYAAFDGYPVNEIAEDDSRNRTFYFYPFTGSDSRFLADFDVFLIEGSVYEDAAWKPVGRLENPPIEDGGRAYVLNSVVNYGTDEKGSADYMNAFLQGSGYSFEPSEVVSHRGVIDISLDLRRSLTVGVPYLLELEMAALDENSAASIWVNSIEMFPFSLDDNSRKWHVFFTPARGAAGDTVDIRLESSGSSGVGGAVSISELVFGPANLKEIDRHSIIRFSEDLEEHFPGGFWPAEPWGRWSSRPEASIHFVTRDDFCSDHLIQLAISSFHAGVNPEKFRVLLNGELLAPVRMDRNGDIMEFHYECTANQLRHAGINKLAFNTETVTSASSPRNIDARRLGASFQYVRFVDKSGTQGPE